MKKVITLLMIATAFLFSYSSFGQQSVIEVEGLIDTTAFWSNDTVKVIGDVTIADNVTLTIAPGTRVVFEGFYYLNVQGTLIADGTETDTIVFTKYDTTGFSNTLASDGSWKGIILDNAFTFGVNGAMNDNDTTILDHCRIEYVKNVDGNYAWGAIAINQYSGVVISHCEIKDNFNWRRGGAVVINTNSDIKVLNNHIHHNKAGQMGGGIYTYNSTPSIKGNTIEYNRTLSEDFMFGKGGGIMVLGMNPTISRNTIRNNSAIYGSGISMLNSFGIVHKNTIVYNTGYNVLPDVRSIGGGIYMESTSSPKITSNKITNNTAIEAGGIYGIESQPQILNNLIANNTGTEAGGAFFFWNSETAIINNTICYNESPAGAAVENTFTEIEFINNIAWKNGTGNDFHLQDEFSTMNIVNCIIEYGDGAIGGIGEYTKTNLDDSDPDFNELPAGTGSGNDGLDIDWSVPPASPAVNAGKTDLGNIILPLLDLQGNDRIHHTFIDIGAFEVHVPMITAMDTIKTNTVWIADTVKIEGQVTVNDDMVLVILPGTYVEFQDTFQMKINGTLLAKGDEDNLIRFTRKDTAGWYRVALSEGGWQGIVFDNSYDGMNNAMADNLKSVLQYCHFSFAKAPVTIDNGGAVRIRYYDKVDISDCIFENNRAWWDGGAVNLDKSDIEFMRCRFINNEANSGAGIFASSSDLVISYCIFDGNHSFDRGAAINTQRADAVLVNNEFVNNRSNNEGGAIFLSQLMAEIRNNLFSNNTAVNRGGAISTYYENFQLINNILVNNTGGLGGAIFMRYVDNAVTVNNTICNNFGQYGGAIYNSYVNHTAHNDIIYGNGSEGQEQYYMSSTTTEVNMNNCNLEGGPESIWFLQGQQLAGTFSDMIDSLPEFINPSEIQGFHFDGIIADWRLRAISPCINAGSMNGIAQYIGTTDYWDNPRIFDETIDIGAFESQHGSPVITLQPINHIVCQDDTVSLYCETRHQAYFQWQKEGADIEGATDNLLNIEGAQTEYTGYYRCRVTNAFGSVLSEPVYLGVESPPEISLQPVPTWGIEGKRTILSTQASGTPPVFFRWFKDGELLSGKKYPDLWLDHTSTETEGLYYCLVANNCGVVSTDSVQVYLAPQICMVTVDSSENSNLVVWEKKSTAPIASYNIYRESIVQGLYEVISNVASADLSVYTDTVVNPAAQSYLYKITAVDPEENESDINLCTPHKTLHLLTSENTEYHTIQCDWDPYYGFKYGTFSIYRGIEEDVLDSIHSMSASTNQWLDTEAEPGVDYYYRIVVRREEPCVPTGNLKAGSGPYSHSLSNQDDNRLQTTGIEKETGISGITAFPNPFSDYTILKFPNPEGSAFTLFVRDVSGKLVYSRGEITGESVILRKGNLKAGYYLIEIRGPETFLDKIIIE